MYAAEKLRGASDDEILATANTEERILLTEDKDFGELVYRLKRHAVGIILLRFEISEREQKISRLQSLLESQPSQIFGMFIVIDKEKVRFRPLLNDH